MNITRENKDELNAVLKVKIEQEDYQERVQNVLKDYRKKANINGFRPGKVPMGLINKMYRTPVVVDEVNKLISESLTKYIVDEKLDILGEPLPSEVDQPNIDWESDENFEFAFDIALAPELDFSLTKRDKIPYYNITIDDKMRNEYIENYTRRFGEFVPTEKVEEMNEMIQGDLVELNDEGQPKEEGVSVEAAKFSVDMVKDEEIKKSLKGTKAGDVFNIDLKKAYPNDTELSSLLRIEKDEVEQINGTFQATVKEVTRFKNAELNQELFDKVFGEGEVKSEDEFKEKIDEEIRHNLKNETEYRFMLDAKDALVKKVKSDLPSEFLKRWLKATNKEITDEQIENDFGGFEEDLKWQLVKNKIAKENEIEVTEEEILEQAKEFTRMQFMQYGLTNIPDEHLDQYSKQMLERNEDKRRIAEKKLEDKIVEHVKEKVKVEEKDISSENFNKLFEK
jgi:trigger factor